MSLEIKNLTKKFGEKTIFEDFSYSFDTKGIYALLGDSGRGKTTLLRIISGLDCDYTGTVIGGGIGMTSYMFQEYRLFPTLTALENALVSVSNSKDSTEIAKATELLGRLGFKDGDFRLRPEELSGGMKQRVAFVRAILRDSGILLLDEPTKELDEGLRTVIYDILKEESMSRLVIMVSHNNTDIEALECKKIIM